MVDLSNNLAACTGDKRILLNILCKRRNGIRICHFNARSLLPKIDEYRELFRESLFDVICISESWLKPEINDQLIHVPGYRILRNDRLGRRGGGVMILVRLNLKCKLIFTSADTESVEYIFIEVMSARDKCLVGCVYRPPNCDFLQPFFNDLAHYSPTYEHVIIGGDFNFDFIEISRQCDSFSSMMNGLGLFRVNTEPTRFTNHSSSLLDVLFSSDLTKVLFNHQISLPGLTDHDLIMLIYDFATITSNSPRTYSYYDYNRVNRDLLLEDAASIHWESFYYMSSVDDQLNFINNSIEFLHQQHVPLITKSIVDEKTPWFSNHLRWLIRLRDQAHANWKRYRLQSLRDEYCLLRNRVTLAIRIAKRNYCSSTLNSNLPTKTLWRNIKSAGITNTNIKSVDLDPDTVNREFTSHTATTQSCLPDYSLSNADVSSLESPLFSFHNVSMEEVAMAFDSIKSNAVGIDGINRRFVMLLLPVLIQPITYLYNRCITSSIFPDAWKLSKVIPIPKKSGPASNEYRPISILPFLSKVFEKLLHLQISQFLHSHNLLHKFQSGFRAGHSCISALLLITEELRLAIDNNKFSILVLLDFSKAFDSVDHKLLCEKLMSKFYFSSQTTKLIFSYLSGRFQSVFAGGSYSSFLPLYSGIPQGSILGPLLFSLFINDIFNVVIYSRLHLYADDVQLYLSRRMGLLEDGFSCINEDLENIYLWSIHNKLRLNPQKSQCLVLYRTLLDHEAFPSVEINSIPIPFVNSAKNLGIIFNKTLTWDEHINSIIKRIYGGLRTLWRTAHFTPLQTRLLLSKALLLPIITYGCEVYGKLDSNNLGKLSVAFNSVVRYVYGLQRYDHVSHYVSEFLGCNLSAYLNYRLICYLAKIIKLGCPSYLFELLNFSRSNRSITLISSRYNYLLTKRLFFVHAVNLWNSLPADLRNTLRSDTLNSFKNKLLHLISTSVLHM